MHTRTFLEHLPPTPRHGPRLRVGDDVFDKLGPALSTDVEAFGEAPPGADRRIHHRRTLARMLAMDPDTARILARVTIALARNQPLLIEGEPATSKTTVATYAGLLLGLPVTRINLSTNVREDQFLGAFQPDPSGAGQWRWTDGPATRAFVEGHLLILDEANLASAGILDRALSMLEASASLRLVERDGRVLEPHPHFRVVATQNPEGHAGRRPLSPAFSDRFVHFRQPPADLASLQAAMSHWVYGRATGTLRLDDPDFTLEGTYRLPRLRRDARLCPHVSRCRALGPKLDALVKVAASIAEHCRIGLLGRDRPSGYTFGRRQLAAFMRDLDAEVAAALAQGRTELSSRFERALQLHFLHPFDPGSDREAVRNLLVAEGLLGASTAARGIPSPTWEAA